MSELIAPPKKWSPYLDLMASDLQSAFGDKRPISIKTYLKDGERHYCGITVKDNIAGMGFSANIRFSTLMGIVREDDGRLISLDAFWDNDARELRCAAIWIENSENDQWDADVDLDPPVIERRLREGRSKLTCLRVYHRPADEKQFPPIAFVKKYCAIWIPDDGRPWDWAPEIDWNSLGLKLEDEVAQLVSIDCHPLSASPDGIFAAVWYKNEGQGWFYNDGLDASSTKQAFRNFCSYGLDLVSSGPDVFASIMYQFPKPADATAGLLLNFSGAAAGTLSNNLFQNFDLTLNETNVTAADVRHTVALAFIAAAGGWSWWFMNFTTPPGQTLAGLPLVAPPGASAPAVTNWNYSMNVKYCVFGLQVTDDAGLHQELLEQAIITQSGFASPAPLPLNWPVFIGLIEPVEAVRLTNGKIWVSVLGQVCNPTGKPITVTNVSLRLRFQSSVLHSSYQTGKLRVDTDTLGNAVDPPATGAVIQSNAPFPKFIDAFEVENDFTTAELKIDVNIKFGGALECFGDTRKVNVAFAPETTMARLPYDDPAEDAHLRWHWGNGIGATDFTTHSSPEHRYAYDLGIQDADNSTLKAGGNPKKNEDYYCWNEPIRAMEAGVIQFIDDSNPDNQGNAGAPAGAANNFIVIYNRTLDVFHVYAHMIKGSAVDDDGNRLVVGASVAAGDLIGRVGNAGQSSEPHLHVGICRADGNGFMRWLPMSFTRVKDSAGNVVSGVPVDGEAYTS